MWTCASLLPTIGHLRNSSIRRMPRGTSRPGPSSRLSSGGQAFSGDTLLCCSYLSSAFVSGQILELFPRDHLARLAGFLQALSLIPRPLLKLAGKTLPLEGLAGSWHLSVKYPSVPRRRASTGRSPTSAATTCTTVCWTQACVPRRGLDLAKFGRSGAETVLRCARQPWGGPSSP